MSTSYDLQEYIVKNAPAVLYYIPNFISKDEEEFLLSKVYSAPKPKWTQLSHRRLQNWGGLPLPKGMIAEPLPSWLQTYMDKITSLGVFVDKPPNHVLVNEYLAGQGIMPHEDGALFYPTVSTISLGSHTLLDFYRHLDKPSSDLDIPSSDLDNSNSNKESGSSDVTSIKDQNNPINETLSLKDRHFLSVLLEPRSLVLVCEDMYKVHLHGIDERTHDTITDKVANLSYTSAKLGETLERGTRVSLTIRNVPRVVKANFLFNRK